MSILVSEEKLRELIREKFKFTESQRQLEYIIEVIIEECKKHP